MAPMRVTVRVSPGSRTTRVGGRYGSAEPPVLIVRVTAPAADNKANRATERAVAAAFGLPSSAVQVIAGRSARTKVLHLAAGDPERFDALLRKGDGR